MDLSQIPLFKALATRLGFLEQRQQVLAQNIANVDTPGYQPLDLKESSFQSELTGSFGRLMPVATHPNDIQPATGAGQFQTVKDTPSAEPKIDGNGVSLENELIKVSKTTLDHQAMVDLYRKQIGLIKTALDRSGGT